MLDKDVRWHMSRVRNCWCELGEPIRSIQRKWRHEWVIERMDCVVDSTGVIWVFSIEPQGDIAGPHVQPLTEVASCGHGTQHRKRIESRYFGVFWVSLVKILHRFHVPDASVDMITLAPQNLHGIQEAFLSGSWSFG